ncbi:hypothetical protein SGLAM104S_10673 [Streptomyces glaucescens]
MGATTYAVPALVVLMSWLALGEVPGPLTLAGGALCLGGCGGVAVAGPGGPGRGGLAAPRNRPGAVGPARRVSVNAPGPPGP